MDAERIIKLPRHHKKTFLVLLFLLFVFCLLGARALGLTEREILLEQVKSVGSALITALLGYFLISTFIPTPDSGEIAEIRPGNITKEFEQLLSSATRWRYKGNFGRYLRGKVLPTLVGRQNVHVSACLIDPTEEKLCEHHAEYRGSINAIDKGRKFTADSVAMEVVVTIVIAAWYAVNRHMGIEVFLSKSFEPLRIDSNDDAMIITVEDRRSPALKITSNHFTYSHFELQMTTARQQARQVNLTGMRKGIELGEIEAADISAVMHRAGMTALCDKLGATDILDACRKSKNPYEN
jgi:hypothetical protein